MSTTTAPVQQALELERDVYTVSRLNREARAIVERGFPLPIWVEGELSNLARPASGHVYFSLKDGQAQVRCAMFRSRASQLAFRPGNGMQVLVRARVGLYEGRGEFQLIVERMEPAGEGALRLKLEQLKRRLAAEGLFDEARKRPLPRFPRRLGVVTSPTGAALRDILQVLARRYPALPVIVYPTAVQGESAHLEIAAALATAGARRECDVLILARGGGSLEDLWSFNEEAVVRAIRACPLPVVSGVGHEVDFTLADLAADLRAPTPSAAAELASPSADELSATVRALEARLQRAAEQRLVHWRQRLVHTERRLVHPSRRIEQLAQRTDELGQRLGHATRRRLQAERARLGHLGGRLAAQHPARLLAARRATLRLLATRAARAAQRAIEARGQRLGAVARALHAVSPLATLERGYAVVRDAEGRILRDAAAVAPGDEVSAELARGTLHCTVDRVERGED